MALLALNIFSTSVLGLFSSSTIVGVLFFFFQAEDGIRDRDVTGVQTCALPISPTPSGRGPNPGDRRRRSRPRRRSPRRPPKSPARATDRVSGARTAAAGGSPGLMQIGRASCRERV